MRDNCVFAGEKRKRAEEKQSNVPLLWGVEVETCMPWSERNRADANVPGAPDFSGFKKEEDGSIRCDPGAVAVEYVLARPLEYGSNETDGVISTLRRILEQGSECAQGSCGTHVHMSFGDVTVQDDPFLLLVMQRKWIAQFDKFAKSFGLRQNRYTQRNGKVWDRQDLGDSNNKYYNFNLRPTFFKKNRKADEGYSELSPPYKYHVEFRGMGDFLTKFTKPVTRTGPFAESWFRRYLSAMAEFLRECVADEHEVTQIRYAPLSYLNLETVGDKMQKQLQSATALTRLDLSENLLGDVAFRTLFHSLEGCVTLTSLDVRNQRTAHTLSDDTVTAMKQYMTSSQGHLQELLVAGNRMTPESFQELIQDPEVALAWVREWTVHTEKHTTERHKRLKVASLPHTREFAFVVFNQDVWNKLQTSKKLEKFQLGDNNLSFPYAKILPYTENAWTQERIQELMNWLTQTCPLLSSLTLGVKQLVQHVNGHVETLEDLLLTAIQKHATSLRHLVFELPENVSGDRISDVIATQCTGLESLNGYVIHKETHSVSLGDRKTYQVLDATAFLAFFRMPGIQAIDLKLWPISNARIAALCVIPDTLTRLTGLDLQNDNVMEKFLNAQNDTLRPRVTVCRVFQGTFFSEDAAQWERLFRLFPNATFTYALQADVVTLQNCPYPQTLVLRELKKNLGLSVFEMHKASCAYALSDVADILATKPFLYEIYLTGLSGTEDVDAAITIAEAVRRATPHSSASIKEIIVKGTWDDAADDRLMNAVRDVNDVAYEIKRDGYKTRDRW